MSNEDFHHELARPLRASISADRTAMARTSHVGYDAGRRKQSPKAVLSRHPTDDIGSTLDKTCLQSEVDREPIVKGQTQFQPLQYHHQRMLSDTSTVENKRSSSLGVFSRGRRLSPSNERIRFLPASHSRPPSSYSTSRDGSSQGRRGSPSRPRYLHARNASSPGGSSPDSRNYRHSVIGLQRLPYAEQYAPTMNLRQDELQAAIGNNASLLSRKKTLEMYRDNVNKTADPEVQYAFAICLVETAQILIRNPSATLGDDDDDFVRTTQNLFVEARQILQSLSDRSYPFAQYYLADGLANGVLNKGKEDDSKALPLFVAASKHGHAESSYRAALCYEYGWGTSKSPLQAAQYLRHAASKNHPGAMFRLSKACLAGDLGMEFRYREGIKWLKRAAESADEQYNAAPFELGVLHKSGYGNDIFKDHTYAVQLYTQSADLGHSEANYRLGDAYEHGKLGCPKDPSLSIHFYNGAASRGHAGAMLALCAWYMIGVPTVLEKDEDEAYEWAKQAAEAGLPKAQYALGYFLEMGIGCQRDPLEANVWYVRAADQNEKRARTRLAAIQAVYSGKHDSQSSMELNLPYPETEPGQSKSEGKAKRRWKVFQAS